MPPEPILNEAVAGKEAVARREQVGVNETRHFGAKATCPTVTKFIAVQIADERVSATGDVHGEFAAWITGSG